MIWRLWENPWRLMLAVNAAVLIGVFWHKIALPPYGNTCIMLLKDTSQTSIITVAELSFQGRLIASSTFKNTEIFTLVAVWYLAMCVPLILLVGRLEKKFGRK